jgi:hypothetical protein
VSNLQGVIFYNRFHHRQYSGKVIFNGSNAYLVVISDSTPVLPIEYFEPLVCNTRGADVELGRLWALRHTAAGTLLIALQIRKKVQSLSEYYVVFGCCHGVVTVDHPTRSRQHPRRRLRFRPRAMSLRDRRPFLCGAPVFVGRGTGVAMEQSVAPVLLRWVPIASMVASRSGGVKSPNCIADVISHQQPPVTI